MEKNMLINDALAATAGTPQVGTLGTQMLQIALVLLIFYFLLIRPQQKRMQKHAQMVSELKIGDKVVTTSGLYGKVVKLDETTATVEIAAGVNVVLERMSIGNVIVENPKHSVSEDNVKKSIKAPKSGKLKK